MDWDDYYAATEETPEEYARGEARSEARRKGKSMKHEIVTGKRYCPKCTKVKECNDDRSGGFAGVKMSKDPVWLVRKVNRETQHWFYGCPNFPECRHSENRPLTAEEVKFRTRARANAFCGPHY
jgi:ssDNA-binding Zn-finger/Zn-ribbon topoisomerase 1